MSNNKNINLLESIVFDNKYKVFDLKWNPVNSDLAFVDFKGRLKIVNLYENEIKIKKNYQISNDSIYTLDYSNDGDSNINIYNIGIFCGNANGDLVSIKNNKIALRRPKAHEYIVYIYILVKRYLK